jgi:hypothetical protein
VNDGRLEIAAAIPRMELLVLLKGLFGGTLASQWITKAPDALMVQEPDLA